MIYIFSRKIKSFQLGLYFNLLWKVVALLNVTMQSAECAYLIIFFSFSVVYEILV